VTIIAVGGRGSRREVQGREIEYQRSVFLLEGRKKRLDIEELERGSRKNLTIDLKGRSD
jgi:hypothetical protein